MIKQEEIHENWEFGNSRAPHQLRLTHIPTGISVMGNTASEEMKPKLYNDLMIALEKALPETEFTPQPQNDGMQAQMNALQAKLDMLMAAIAGGQVLSKSVAKRVTAQTEPKKRGRKPGTKLVGGKAIAPKTLVSPNGVETVSPEGYSVLDPTKVAPAPSSVPPLPTRVYKPAQTVSVVSDKAAAKGIVA